MTRPKILHVGGTLYWVIRTRNPDTMVLKDADSTPTVAVRKNGASTADSVTVTKRSATTGIYDCSYNPAGEVEGDEFTIEESATVTGTTTGSATYTNSWEFTVIAVERGTDGGATSAQALDIQSRIPDSLDDGLMKSSVQAMAANTLTASALASDAVSEIAAAVGGGTGSGARTITITVNDGTSPLEGAKVRVRQGSENYVQTTNASGVVTFNLDDFTWNVAITKTGYTFTATTLVVNGSTSPPTYSMTLVSLTPSDPDKVTGYWTVLGENGEPKEGAVVTVRAIKAKSGSVGVIHVKTARTESTDSEGIAEFANMLPGWSYSVSLDGETIATVAIASDATDEVELGSCILAE